MAVNGHPEYPSRKAAEFFVNLVEERTNGKVKIFLYNEDQFGYEKNITEQIEFGGIDFAIVNSLYLVDYVERMENLLAPNVFKDVEDMMNALNNDPIESQLKESFKNEKINILAWYQGSSRGISHKVASIDDLINKKVRVPESQLMINKISSISFLPVPVNVEEVNNYLKLNYIDAAEEELLEYYYEDTNKVAQNFTFTPWVMLPEVIISSNTAIKQLTMEQQGIIAEAAKESVEFERLQIQIIEQKVIKELKEQDVIFSEAKQVYFKEGNTFFLRSDCY
jgi:TRAP-type C4-dicarboxylate transport system substrate-binding protein